MSAQTNPSSSQSRSGETTKTRYKGAWPFESDTTISSFIVEVKRPLTSNPTDHDLFQRTSMLNSIAAALPSNTAPDRKEINERVLRLQTEWGGEAGNSDEYMQELKQVHDILQEEVKPEKIK